LGIVLSTAPLATSLTSRFQVFRKELDVLRKQEKLEKDLAAQTKRFEILLAQQPSAARLRQRSMTQRRIAEASKKQDELKALEDELDSIRKRRATKSASIPDPLDEAFEDTVRATLRSFAKGQQARKEKFFRYKYVTKVETKELKKNFKDRKVIPTSEFLRS